MLEWDKIGDGYVAICRDDIVTISKQKKLWILSSAEKGFVMVFRQLHNAKNYAQGEFGN